MSEPDNPPEDDDRTLTLTCEAPECGQPFAWRIAPGRRPKYCPEHRREAADTRTEIAYRAQKRDIAEEVLTTRDARDVARLARLAAGLRVYPDPLLAAKFAGVRERGEALDALVAQTRALHPRTVGGDMRDTAVLAEAVTHVLLAEVLERRAELPARDLANFARFALQAAQELRAEGPQTNYVALELAFAPPPADGRLTEEQRAKVTDG